MGKRGSLFTRILVRGRRDSHNITKEVVKVSLDRQPLESRKGKKRDSSLQPPEETSCLVFYNSLVPMCVI